MHRLDRLTAILIQLQSKRVVRAQEMADRFGISLRTVYRDVRSLETAGVPVIGEAGIGYSLVEGYRLPPVQFTRDEAAAFLTAEKLVGQYTDAGVANQFQAGLLKIRAVLRLSEKDALEQLDDAVQVVPNRAGTTGLAEQALSMVLQALSGKEVLSMRYAGPNAEKPVQRQIEPIGVLFKNDAWYVVAWCRLRADVRNFRLDRMQDMHPTGEHFEPHERSLQDYLDEAEPRTPALPARITVPNEVLAFIGRQKKQQGFLSEKTTGGHTEMHFQTPSYEYLARWAMQFADKVVALAPAELERAFRRIVQAAHEKM